MRSLTTGIAARAAVEVGDRTPSRRRTISQTRASRSSSRVAGRHRGARGRSPAGVCRCSSRELVGLELLEADDVEPCWASSWTTPLDPGHSGLSAAGTAPGVAAAEHVEGPDHEVRRDHVGRRPGRRRDGRQRPHRLRGRHVRRKRPGEPRGQVGVPLGRARSAVPDRRPGATRASRLRSRPRGERHRDHLPAEGQGFRGEARPPPGSPGCGHHPRRRPGRVPGLTRRAHRSARPRPRRSSRWWLGSRRLPVRLRPRGRGTGTSVLIGRTDVLLRSRPGSPAPGSPTPGSARGPSGPQGTMGP